MTSNDLIAPTVGDLGNVDVAAGIGQAGACPFAADLEHIQLALTFARATFSDDLRRPTVVKHIDQ